MRSGPERCESQGQVLPAMIFEPGPMFLRRLLMNTLPAFAFVPVSIPAQAPLKLLPLSRPLLDSQRRAIDQIDAGDGAEREVIVHVIGYE